VVIVAIHWDDIAVLRTLDEWEAQGRAYHMTGQDLMQAVSGQHAVDDADRESFVRLLSMLAARGRLVFRLQSFGNYQPAAARFKLRLGALWVPAHRDWA
jgi:hypothetical protein